MVCCSIISPKISQQGSLDIMETGEEEAFTDIFMDIVKTPFLNRG